MAPMRTRADPIAAARTSRFEVVASVEQLALAAALFWTLSANHSFLSAALRGHAPGDPGTWGFALALAAMLAGLHAALVLALANRWTVKPLLSVLIVAAAVASYFIDRFGVYLDPSMMRNVLRTDAAEARELLGWPLLPRLALQAGLPLALLWRVRVVRESSAIRALGRRAAAIVTTAGVAAVSLLLVFQPFSSLMRNDRQLRHLITPANLLWSVTRVAAADARDAAQPRRSIGLDARLGATAAVRRRPLLLVLVVGETARAANWGLSGYARQTTPELAALSAVNFGDVTSCGTNTEVSVPCMFAPVGRRAYDETRIRGSESLLHVAARAGVAVYWRDNQSGCKGVCDGLPGDELASLNPAGMCRNGRCLDEALLFDLDRRLAAATGTQLLVLHMIGNHGPAYHRRYPAAFARFVPACEDDDLQRCTREQIVNAYDNALLYTDHVLASLVAKLRARAASVDSALVYVSDHGESLGENRLYLHGMPWPIAPAEQTRVPMLMWASEGFDRSTGLDQACLRRRAQLPASHDHLFHTVLGLLDVQTALYERGWDLTAQCRAPRGSAA